MTETAIVRVGTERVNVPGILDICKRIAAGHVGDILDQQHIIATISHQFVGTIVDTVGIGTGEGNAVEILLI